MGALSMMLVKKSVLVLLNPVTSVNDKYLSLHRAGMELIRDVTGGGAFSNTNHLLVLREESSGGQKNKDDANYAKLKGLVRDLNTT